MTFDLNRLKASALGLWRETQLPGEAGQRYLERKASLMGADEAALEAIARYVENLDEGLDLLATLATDGQISSFARQELADFCELTGIEDSLEAIIERYNKKLPASPASNASPSLEIAVVSTAEAVDAEPLDVRAEDTYDGAAQTNAADQAVWLAFLREASDAITSLQHQLEKANSGEALIALNLPMAVAQRCESVESIVSAELVRRGHLRSERALFEAQREPLLMRVRRMHTVLKQSVQEKRAATRDFSESMQGGARFVGGGSMGMVAAAGAMNMVGGLFSGVGRWNRTRSFASEFDRQIIDAFASALEDLVTELADVLSSHYDVLSEHGLAPSGVMFQRMHDAHYLIEKLAHIPSPEGRLDALRGSLREYPFVEIDWLSSLAELIPILGGRILPALDAALPTFTGQPEDLDLVRVLAGIREDGGEDLLAAARSLSSCDRFSLVVANGPWPIGVQEADLTLRTRLAMGLYGARLDEWLPVEADQRQALLALIRRPVEKTDVVATLLSFLQNLRDGQIAAAAKDVGTLRVFTDASEAHRILEALWLGALHTPQLPASVETVNGVCARLGLDAKAISGIRHSDGYDLLILGLWSEIERGRVESARALERSLPADFSPSIMPTQVTWIGSQVLEGRPDAAALQRLARRLLREDIFNASLPSWLLTLLYAVRGPNAVAPAWDDFVVRLTQAFEMQDRAAIAAQLRQLAQRADSTTGARLLCAAIGFAGYEAERDAGDLARILATGLRVDQLGGCLQDESLRRDLDTMRERIVDSARNWLAARIERTHDLAPTLLRLDDPASQRLNDAQRQALCRHMADGDDSRADYLVPDHLLGCWVDSKSLILIFAYGIVVRARGAKSFQFVPIYEIRGVSRSGFINDYLKLELSNRAVEIPAALDTTLRSHHDLLIHFLKGLASDAATSYRENWQEDWRALDPADWVRLSSQVPLRSRYVVQFCIEDEPLFHTLEAAKARPDAPRAVTSSTSDDARDDALAAQLEGLRKSAAELPVGRSTTIYTYGQLEQRKVKEFVDRVRDKIPDLAFDASDILVYYDETLTGVGDRGVAVCPNCLVWTVDGQGAYSWVEIDSLKISGMLNKKIVIRLKSGDSFQIVLTQGNKEAEIIVAYANDLLSKHQSK